MSLITILREILNGPSPEAAYLLNPGDRGLLASLDALSAEEASARPDGRSSVASHADHLRYGLGLLNRWARGENPWPQADWAASWTRQQVTEEQWRALREGLRGEATAWIEAAAHPPSGPDAEATVIGSVAHLAYHLGAMRQIVVAAAGPRATD